MLPPGFERKALTFVGATPVPDDFDLSTLTREQRQVLELVQKQGRVSLRQIEKTLGKKKAQAIVSQLVKRGLATRSYELEPVRAKPKTAPYLQLAVSAEEARQEADQLDSRAIRWMILAALATLESEQGDLKKAENYRQEAIEAINFITKHIGDEDLRRSFLDMYNVKSVFEGG